MSSERLAFADELPIGVYRTDAAGQCVWVNGRWTELTGLSEAEALGSGWAEALHPSDRERVAAEWDEAARTETPFHAEYRFQRPDGGVVWVLGRAHALDDPVTGERGYLGTVMDITARKLAERTRADLISVVSHEIRGPLAAIHGSLSYLTGDTISDPDQRARLLEMAIRNSRFLSLLVDDLLVFERLEAGKVQLEVEPVDIASVVGDALDMSDQRAADPHAALESEVGVDEVVADERRVLQVLANLVGNALKFSPAESTVRVTVKPCGENVRFTVTDQGRGIPPEMQERIFKPFEQVEADDHNKHGGAGLGLAICRAIVEKHGGSIHVESELGVGSRFVFELPKEGPPSPDGPSS